MMSTKTLVKKGIVGKLIKASVGNFERSKEWKYLKQAYEDFISENIKNRLNNMEEEISSLLQV